MLKPVKRKGSPFYIARGSVNGRQIERSTKTDNHAIAKQRCVEIAAEIIAGNGSAVEDAPYTFRDAVTDYLNQGGSQRFLQKPLDYFGEIEVSRINNKALYEAAKVLYPNAQPATISRQLFTPVSAVVQCAADNDLCPPRRFKRPKSDNPRTLFMLPGQGERLIREAHQCRNGYFPALLTFFIGQGTRVMETLLLDGRDVNLDAGFAIIRPETSKSGRERRLTLIPRVIAALSLLPTIGQAGAVFRNEHGQPYKITVRADGSISGGQIQHTFKACVDRAELEGITPHVCRHTWATWFYAQTRDPARLKEQGGWAKEEMWMRYTKIGTPDLGDQALEYGWEFEARPARVKDYSQRRFNIK